MRRSSRSLSALSASTPAGAYALLVTAVVLGLGGYFLLFVEPGIPVNRPRTMGYTTACVTPDAALTQSFRVRAEAFRALTLYPVVSSSSTAAASGQVVFELREDVGPPETAAAGSSGSGGGGRGSSGGGAGGSGAMAGRRAGAAAIQRMTVPAARLAGVDAFVFELSRLARGEGREFTLWIGRTAADGCVAFRASGVNMPEGRLTIGERQQWGDLLFRAHGYRGTALHTFQRWLAARTGVEIPLVLLASLAIGYGLTLGGLCHALLTTRARDAASRGNLTASSSPAAGRA